MTRILSDLLQTSDPHFRLQLHQLERLSGHQNTDIKLSVEVVQAAKQKVKQLGLDQHDTTSQELYHVLMQRVSADDQRLERTLQTRAATYISAEAKVIDGLVHALEAEVHGSDVMAIKPAVIKRLLKKVPPKKLIKTLGYRSLDAMLRQEPPALLVAASLHIESLAWKRALLDSYKHLKPVDFENRQLQILHPSADRWQVVAEKLVTEQAHTVIGVPELGALIILPLPKQRPAGMVVATAALAIQELNVLTSMANYMRASQVESDFGIRIKAVATGDVFLATPHLPQAMPWQLIQKYFATSKAVINEDIFGPYVSSVDFHWRNVEATLATICPALAFWEDTAHLSFIHHGAAVSMNVVDAAINSCNQLAFDARQVYYAQQSLWSELLLRYVDHESVERAVAGLLRPKLAYQAA